MEMIMNVNYCDDNNIPTLSDAAAKEIQELLGEDTVFFVAFGSGGKSLPIRPAGVQAKILDLNVAPIKTQKIFQIDAFSLVAYEGSHVCSWRAGGVLYQFTKRGVPH
jgi:hypothetical protein